jgi:hypothetical protein
VVDLFKGKSEYHGGTRRKKMIPRTKFFFQKSFKNNFRKEIKVPQTRLQTANGIGYF